MGRWFLVVAAGLALSACAGRDPQPFRIASRLWENGFKKVFRATRGSARLRSRAYNLKGQHRWTRRQERPRSA
jgi:hypothetical protein